MKKVWVVANWKSNKTRLEAKEWLHQFSILNSQFSITTEVILCPSFTLLPLFRSYILDHQSPLKLGAQNISAFASGAYTGEVNGEQIKELADYVIIGHSERRKYFNETEEMISNKLKLAQAHHLSPILCISDLSQLINSQLATSNSQLVVAYEPLSAIGSNHPDTPADANQIARKIKAQYPIKTVLYGGSVNANDVQSFTEQEFVDGVLIGKASLNAQEFSQIIANV